jgi:hypothetical protein
MNKRALALLLLSLVACKKSGGDFEGEIGMSIKTAGGPPSEMVFEAAGDKVRLGITAPDGQRSHALVKPDGKMVLVVDAQKAWMDMDLTKVGAAVAEADPGGNPVVNKTGRHETIAGHDCEAWEIKHGSGKRTETCIADGLAAFDFGALLPGGSSSSALGTELHQKKLFPLRSVEFDAAGKETSRMEVTRVERKKLDRAIFEVPASYTKIDPTARKP